MADNSPQMFQLPGPSVPYMGNAGTGAAAGLQAAGNTFQTQEQINQRQQQINMEKQQQTISQVDTLLKSGMNYPGMLPTFWPAIATRMNSLSPDYQLDPKNPPENLKSFATALSSISDGVADKAVSLDQAHAATKQLIQSSYPTPAPSDGGQGSPTASPQNASPVQPVTQGQPQQPGTGQPPQQQGSPSQQPPSNPLTDFAQIKAQYDKANQLISQAPIEGPQSQANLRKQLESSSLGLNYKKSLEQLAAVANAQFSQGEQNKRNEFNQKQDMIRSAASSFPAQSEQFKNVSDNFSAFNHLMQMSQQMENQGGDTTARVQAEKTALLNFAQMAYPGTGRPGNPEMLETMEKSGPYGTLIAQSLNRLDKGDVMTEKQIKGLRQTALTLYQGREEQQSQLEKSYAQNIQLNGGNPSAFLKNFRPQSVHSTSSLYPSQSTDTDPIIGHTMKTRKGNFQYLGGEKNNPSNWAQIEGDSGQ